MSDGTTVENYYNKHGQSDSSLVLTSSKTTDEMHVRVSESGNHPKLGMLNVKKADFIAAVGTELNGIFISRDELPEVSIDRDGYWHSIFKAALEQDENTRSFYEDALEALAKSEYLKKNPPVDEQQVEALVSLLNETSDGHAQSAPNIARRLIATGKVTVSTD